MSSPGRNWKACPSLYIPFLAGFFGVLPLAWLDLAIALGAGALVFVGMEIEKKSGKSKKI